MEDQSRGKDLTVHSIISEEKGTSLQRDSRELSKRGERESERVRVRGCQHVTAFLCRPKWGIPLSNGHSKRAKS